MIDEAVWGICVTLGQQLDDAYFCGNTSDLDCPHNFIVRCTHNSSNANNTFIHL